MARKKFKEKEPGQYIGHCACPDCGSSDAGSYYQHEDGSHSFSCFSAGCDASYPDFDIEGMVAVVGKAREIDWEVEMEKLEEVRDNLAAMDNPDRKMRADAYEFYGVQMEMNEAGDRIEKIFYPTYRDGQHVGYRNRKRFEGWMAQVEKKPELLGVLKDFTGGIGDTKKGIEMFGQHLFEPGGKRIIITCGEEDAVATYHMTKMNTKFDGGYPTVSVPSGEDVSGVKPNLEYLSSFGEIYIIADQDKQGALFQEQLCKLLPVGKVRLVSLPKGFKDPSDMWKACNSDSKRKKVAKALYHSLFSAEKYSPAGIMSMSEGWGSYTNRGKDPLILFPDSFGELNFKTFGGYALGEIVNIIAPSSVGKSSFVKEMIHTALETTNYNIGVIAVEETIDEFIEGMLSIHMSQQLNELSDDERDMKAEWEAFQELCTLRPEEYRTPGIDEADRIQFLDHQGACSGEELLEKITFLIKGLDCKIIILDPVTLAFSGHDTDDDEMASAIVKTVKREKVAWINVHHVRKNGQGGTANSEGGDLAEEDIKGTGAWFQTGMINLIFTRNKVHDHPIIRNTTRIKMSKCRRHGKSTGVCGYIFYDGSDGRLKVGEDPAKILEREGGGDDAYDAFPED